MLQCVVGRPISVIKWLAYLGSSCCQMHIYEVHVFSVPVYSLQQLQSSHCQVEVPPPLSMELEVVDAALSVLELALESNSAPEIITFTASQPYCLALSRWVEAYCQLLLCTKELTIWTEYYYPSGRCWIFWSFAQCLITLFQYHDAFWRAYRCTADFCAKTISERHQKHSDHIAVMVF